MKLGLPIIALALLAMSHVACTPGAASVNSSFGVSATVEGGCLASATPEISAAQTPSGLPAAVTVSCTNPTAYSIAVSRTRTVVGGIATGSGSPLLHRSLIANGSSIADLGVSVSPEASEGIWSADLHALSKKVAEAGRRVDESATERVYPDTITVTITY